MLCQFNSLILSWTSYTTDTNTNSYKVSYPITYIQTPTVVHGLLVPAWTLSGSGGEISRNGIAQYAVMLKSVGTSELYVQRTMEGTTYFILIGY